MIRDQGRFRILEFRFSASHFSLASAPISFLSVFFIITALFISPGLLAAEDLQSGPDSAINQGSFGKGPLYGNSLFINYYNYFTFPFFPAQSPEKGDLQWGVGSYLTNDVLYFISTGSDGKQTVETERDYESIVVEADFNYSFTDRWMVGGMFRFVGYYGGFMDSVIESFHRLFGFQNAGREYFEYGRVYMSMSNDNNVNFSLDRPVFFFGDIDLWVKYTFYENRILSLAATGGVKIPTGALSGLPVASSGYPDFAVAGLGDLRLGRFFSLYWLTGLTLPTDAFALEGAHPYPFFQGNISAEFHPTRVFSLLAQFAFKSPSFTGGITPQNKDLPLNNYPQTDLLIGVIFQYNGMKWQFYFEEDPFTYQGTDITFNIRFSQEVNIFR